MVDISRDIEWEQNFEINADIQSKLNKDDDDNSIRSQSPDSSSSEDNDGGTELLHNELRKKKRPRRPSNAELIDRAMQQQKNRFNALRFVILFFRSMESTHSLSLSLSLFPFSI